MGIFCTPFFLKTKIMKYLYIILAIVIVVFLAFHLIPIAFALFRILIGLGVLVVFGLGMWVGYQLNKNE